MPFTRHLSAALANDIFVQFGTFAAKVAQINAQAAGGLVTPAQARARRHERAQRPPWRSLSSTMNSASPSVIALAHTIGQAPSSRP